MPRDRIRRFGNITNLKRWLSQSDVLESDKLDFKESLPDQDNVRKIFCAFANTRGGRIIFGVTDRKRATGISISAQQLKDRIVSILGNNVYPADIRFEIIEEIKFGRGAKSIFIVEILNSEYASRPHLFIKNNAVYIPIRKNGSCDYLKSHAEIRSAFLLDDEFYTLQSSDIRIILERIKTQPGNRLNRIEQSLLLKFRLYLLQQATFDQQQGFMEKDLGQIIDENCEIENLISSVSGVVPYQTRITDLRDRIEKHLSSYRRYYNIS